MLLREDLEIFKALCSFKWFETTVWNIATWKMRRALNFCWKEWAVSKLKNRLKCRVLDCPFEDLATKQKRRGAKKQRSKAKEQRAKEQKQSRGGKKQSWANQRSREELQVVGDNIIEKQNRTSNRTQYQWGDAKILQNKTKKCLPPRPPKTLMQFLPRHPGLWAAAAPIPAKELALCPSFSVLGAGASPLDLATFSSFRSCQMYKNANENDANFEQ